MIEHLHHIIFLVGLHQCLAANGSLPLLQVVKCLLQFVFVIFIQEIAVRRPLSVNAEQLLHLLALYAYELLLLPWRVVYHPADEYLVG